jgi:hypothetical protein
MKMPTDRMNGAAGCIDRRDEVEKVSIAPPLRLRRGWSCRATPASAHTHAHANSHDLRLCGARRDAVEVTHIGPVIMGSVDGDVKQRDIKFVDGSWHVAPALRRRMQDRLSGGRDKLGACRT